MGLEIDRAELSEAEFQRFDARLRASVAALRQLLAGEGFGAGETTIGTELEFHLIDEAARPSPVNRHVLGATTHAGLTMELNRFNLEINARPAPLAGRPFTALAEDLEAALSEARRAAGTCGSRVVAVGILPTLGEDDLTGEAMTQRFRYRYRAVSAGLRRIRAQPFQLRIEGGDALAVEADEVTFEGANASFQIHLGVDPTRFADAYNAAQFAVAALLAAAGNAPLFLGGRLWEETRIALLRQAVDDRGDALDDDWRSARVSFGHGFARRGAWELLAESATLRAPLIAVIGEEDHPQWSDGGRPSARRAQAAPEHGLALEPVGPRSGRGSHLRIELRALPSGPSVIDLMARVAFQVGLVLALEGRMAALLQGMAFTHARRNFYQAARLGLGAELLRPVEASAAHVRHLPGRADGEAALPPQRATVACHRTPVELDLEGKHHCRHLKGRVCPISSRSPVL